MMNRITITFFILICHLLLFSSCLNNGTKDNNLKKPKNIPSNAFWVGGVDGGNWFLIKKIHPHKNCASIDIYNEHNGNIIISKKFFLVCALDTPSFNQNQYFHILDSLQANIIAFDGTSIILKTIFNNKNCVLK